MLIHYSLYIWSRYLVDFVLSRLYYSDDHVALWVIFIICYYWSIDSAIYSWFWKIFSLFGRFRFIPIILFRSELLLIIVLLLLSLFSRRIFDYPILYSYFHYFQSIGISGILLAIICLFFSLFLQRLFDNAYFLLFMLFYLYLILFICCYQPISAGID